MCVYVSGDDVRYGVDVCVVIVCGGVMRRVVARAGRGGSRRLAVVCIILFLILNGGCLCVMV